VLVAVLLVAIMLSMVVGEVLLLIAQTLAEVLCMVEVAVVGEEKLTNFLGEQEVHGLSMVVEQEEQQGQPV
jgi:hypothetical protein